MEVLTKRNLNIEQVKGMSLQDFTEQFAHYATSTDLVALYYEVNPKADGISTTDKGEVGKAGRSRRNGTGNGADQSGNSKGAKRTVAKGD